MLYNFLRGDLGFLPVLRQLLHGDERVTEGGRKAGPPAQQSLVSRGSGERALESHSRPLLTPSLSHQYAIRSFVNRPVTLSARRTPPPAYLALGRCACAAQTDTRLVSINHRRSDSAAEEKSPPNGAHGRTDGRGRTRARWCGRRAGAASNGGAPFKTRRANRRSH